MSVESGGFNSEAQESGLGEWHLVKPYSREDLVSKKLSKRVRKTQLN